MKRFALLLLVLMFAVSGLLVQGAHAAAHVEDAYRTLDHHYHGSDERNGPGAIAGHSTHHHDLSDDVGTSHASDHPAELHLVGLAAPEAAKVHRPGTYAPVLEKQFNGYLEPGPGRDPDPERT